LRLLVTVSVPIPIALLIAFIVTRRITLVVLAALVASSTTAVALPFTIAIPVTVVIAPGVVFRATLLRPCRLLLSGAEQTAPQTYEQARTRLGGTLRF
jgi:glutamate racemase